MNDVVAALEGAGLEVRSDAGTRGMYSSDASLYRVPPLAVVRPRDVGEVAAALAVARETGVPFTSRGAGTSVAGNAIGRGIVLDFSRHLNRVLEIDPEARTAVVEPGVVHAVLQKAATPHGVRFGPDPSTHPRCTIGGMIGNNACGSRSLAYGRTSDNVASLKLLTAAGDELITTAPQGAVVDDLRQVVGRHLATARTEFDRFGRQVSGYAVQHLLPERFDLTQAFVGSEGTLAVITEATVKLVVDAPVRVVVVLGFRDIVAAGEASPAVVAHGPTSCEGLDSRLLDVLRAQRGASAVPPLPRGAAWLFVELAGDDLGEVEARARKLAGDGIGEDALVVTDPATQARLWRIREDGAGLAGRAPSGRPAWPGWEDAAVPPARLGDYLARFDELVAAYDMTSAPFGHFGDGCMHVRLDFPLDQPGGTKVMRDFLTDAAKLVGEFGGSLSGEHGDGRARSELLPHMYSADAIALFAGIKHAFDPGNLLNPGVLVDPDPVDADVRPDPPRQVGPEVEMTGAVLARRAVPGAVEEGRFQRVVHVPGDVQAVVDDHARDPLPDPPAHRPGLPRVHDEPFLQGDRADPRPEAIEGPCEVATARERQVVGIPGVAGAGRGRQSAQSHVEPERGQVRQGRRGGCPLGKMRVTIELSGPPGIRPDGRTRSVGPGVERGRRRAEARQEMGHRLGIASRPEDRNHPGPADRREEVAQVHLQDDIPADVGLDIRPDRPAGPEPVRGLVGRDHCDDAVQDPPLDGLEPGPGRLDQPGRPAPLGDPSMVVMPTGAGRQSGLTAPDVGEPVERLEIEPEPIGQGRRGRDRRDRPGRRDARRGPHRRRLARARPVIQDRGIDRPGLAQLRIGQQERDHQADRRPSPLPERGDQAASQRAEPSLATAQGPAAPVNEVILPPGAGHEAIGQPSGDAPGEGERRGHGIGQRRPSNPSGPA